METIQLNGIKIKKNPYHNDHYYLDIDFERIDLDDKSKMFKEIAQKLGRPLQVMISSKEKYKIAVLNAAGFRCKRKCYQVEAKRNDYVGTEKYLPIQYSYRGEKSFEICCERMLKRYVMTHQNVSPWTGSKEDFVAQLPDCVTYLCSEDEVSCFAFVENEEIAYVDGKSLQEFHEFAQALISDMFRRYERITFESDDCDEMAMELRRLFLNQSEDSFDTYVQVKTVKKG